MSKFKSGDAVSCDLNQWFDLTGTVENVYYIPAGTRYSIKLNKERKPFRVGSVISVMEDNVFPIDYVNPDSGFEITDFNVGDKVMPNRAGYISYNHSKQELFYKNKHNIVVTEISGKLITCSIKLYNTEESFVFSPSELLVQKTNNNKDNNKYDKDNKYSKRIVKIGKIGANSLFRYRKEWWRKLNFMRAVNLKDGKELVLTTAIDNQSAFMVKWAEYEKIIEFMVRK